MYDPYDPLLRMMVPFQPPIQGVDLTQAQAQAPSIGAMMPPARPMTPAPNPMAALAPRAPGFNIDPMQMLLMQMGAGLMQPRAPGQTSAGHFGQSALSGLQGAMGVAAQQQRSEREERRLGMDERRLRETEETGKLQREDLAARIDQNSRMYPTVIKEAEAKLKKLEQDGRLTEEQINYWREKVKLYPKEVEADLKRAEKLSGTEHIFESTVRSIAKHEGIPEEEARARLGADYFGKRSGVSAGVQNMRELQLHVQAVNPKRDDESPEAYRARISQEVLRLQTERKRESYFDSKMKFLEKNALFFKNYGEATKAFDEEWKRTYGEVPTPANAGPTPQAGRSVTKADVAATAKEHGVSEEEILKQLKQRGITVRD